MKEYLFQKENDRQYSKLSSMEWLETNGSGGYASSTIAMANTRKYHGLLVLPLTGYPEKFVLLSSLEERFENKSGGLNLSSHAYSGAVYPDGYTHIKKFSPSPVPTFVYAADKLLVKKEIMMPNGGDTVMIRYTLVKNSEQIKLILRPLFAYRIFHSLAKENGFARMNCVRVNGGFSFEPYGNMPKFYFQCSHPMEIYNDPLWYKKFEYQREIARGFECEEDLFAPAAVGVITEGNDEIIISAGLTNITGGLHKKWNSEYEERLEADRKLIGLKSPVKELSKTAGSFITKKQGKVSVVAGYHWFLDWGRDAMIALPGLTLTRGNYEDCLSVLLYFARYEKKGLIPNYIHPNGEASYNTVDASLWFIWAVQQFVMATGDYSSVKNKLWPTICNIVQFYSSGTDYNICMLENGLIRAGDERTQLTWMDANAYGKPVTPRWGCSVEINALWYNSLCFALELSKHFKKSLPIPEAIIPRVKDSFMRIFWSAERGYLADTIMDELRDLSIRPNQIFAVSLPHSMLTKTQMRQVMECVTNHLLTPRGLRTLSPSDPRYKGFYGGSPDERDSAYHNGTVWPWLMGHYGEALLKSETPKAVEKLKGWLKGFEPHLYEEGIGTVSEIFSGDYPHRAEGCISQAWSVAEILRLYSLLDTAT